MKHSNTKKLQPGPCHNHWSQGTQPVGRASLAAGAAAGSLPSVQDSQAPAGKSQGCPIELVMPLLYFHLFHVLWLYWQKCALFCPDTMHLLVDPWGLGEGANAQGLRAVLYAGGCSPARGCPGSLEMRLAIDQLLPTTSWWDLIYLAARQMLHHSEDYSFHMSSDCAFPRHNINAVSSQVTPKLLVPLKSYSFFAYNATDSCPLALMHKVRLIIQFPGGESSQQRSYKDSSEKTCLTLNRALKCGVTVLIKALNQLSVSAVPTLALLHLQGSQATGKAALSHGLPEGQSAHRGCSHNLGADAKCKPRRGPAGMQPGKGSQLAWISML